MSPDGFTAGPDIGEANPMGRAASGCANGPAKPLAAQGRLTPARAAWFPQREIT
jgi:hypothetical protein